MPTTRSSDGAQLYFEDSHATPPWKPTPPVVLMHHGVALNSDAWAGWVPRLLQAGLRVVRMDMRGFGRSDPVAPGHRWSMDEFFADINAVANAVGAQSFHYVGESLGGLVGLALASRQPQRVASLCLLSTPYEGERVGPALDDWRVVIEREGMSAWSHSLMPMRFAPDAIPQAMWDWVVELQARCAPHAVLGQAEFIRTQSVADELSAIGAPVLVMSSDGSPFVDRSLARDLQARLPMAEIQWYPGHRHSLLVSGARQCADAYAHFLRRHFPTEINPPAPAG